jgi:hypothetical protein
MDKEKKVQIGFRIDPQILDRLKSESNKIKRVSMTDIIESSLDHLFSLPEDEREKIIHKFLFGKTD